MIIRNFYDDRLAQASYLVGCAATGEAIVIDPLRDPQPYLDMAESLGLHIVAITETHIHADYISGTRELAAKTGARMHLSDEGTELWKYEFPEIASAQLLKDGDIIKIGNLTLRALHTPGHTPEHLSFLLTDHPASDEPHSLFTGDFVFVGDVGRPDLLERAANFKGTMEAGARQLFQSLRLLDQYDDSLLIWPAHGAGSACGKSLGGSPVTSLGYERKTNWALKIKNEDQFVDEVLSGQPEPPFYFKEMKRLNKVGPTILGDIPTVQKVAVPASRILDIRQREDLRAGYIRGAIAIPGDKGLTNWAGWLLSYNEPVTLIADSQEAADQADYDMRLIGLDVVSGWIPSTSFAQDSRVIVPTETCSGLRDGDYVLDVRGLNEWKALHVEGGHHIPLGYLTQRMHELPRDQRIVVHCASGGRSPIAISLLLANGFTQVAEIAGGITEISERCPVLVGMQ